VPRRLAAPVKIGITGLPGSGKTQTLLRIIQLLEQEGVKVGGMVTEPIIEKQRRTGFQITNWLTKEHEVFAHEGLKSRVRSGRYGVNLAALDGLGTRSLAEARESADVIVIDEVGKMEVESEGADRGTTVSIHLPISPAPMPREPALVEASADE